MTLAFKSPETRLNKARAAGNSPANVCAHVRVLRRAVPSLPPARQTQPAAGSVLGEHPADSPAEETTAWQLHGAPSVDPSTSEFSEFPAYWRAKLDSCSQLPACGKQLGAGRGGYGARRIKKKDYCVCREIYSSNTDFVVAKFRLGICIWKFFMKALILTTWIALLRDYSI